MSLLNAAKISRLLLDMDPGQNNISETHSSTQGSEQVEVNASVTHHKSFLINEPHKWKWSLRWDLMRQVRPAVTEEKFMMHRSYCTHSHTHAYTFFSPTGPSLASHWFHSSCSTDGPAGWSIIQQSTALLSFFFSPSQLWIKVYNKPRIALSTHFKS